MTDFVSFADILSCYTVYAKNRDSDISKQHYCECSSPILGNVFIQKQCERIRKLYFQIGAGESSIFNIKNYAMLYVDIKR